VRVLCLILACVALATAARADAPASPTDPAAAGVIRSADMRLRELGSGVHVETFSDNELRSRLAAIPRIEERLAGTVDRLSARLRDVDARLGGLGPAPGAGQTPDPADIAAARMSLTLTRRSIAAQLQQARLLTVVADQTSGALEDQLRTNFRTRLWTRSRSIADPHLFDSLDNAIPIEVARIGAILGDEGRAIGAAARGFRGALWTGLGVLVALFLGGPARGLLRAWGYRLLASQAPPTRLRKAALALWLALAAGLTLLFAGLAVRAGLAAAGALTPDFDRLLMVVTRVVASVALVEGLGRALLSPRRPIWRLAPLPDDLVARLAPYPTVIALAVGLALLISNLDAAFGGAVASTVVGERLTILMEILAIGAALWTAARGRSALLAPPSGAVVARESRVPWVLAALAAGLALAVALVAAVVGYLALAGLLIREMIWVATILAMLFLAWVVVDDAFPALLSVRSPVGRFLRGPLNVADESADHIAIVLSGLGRLALLPVALMLMLMPAGAAPGEFLARIVSARSHIKIGQISLSPGAVLGSIALFLLGMAATHAVRRWLEERYLPRTHLDVGVRTSVSALFSYVGVAVALILAMAYLGLSFTQFTLFASALSVGIGFGLQSVISNFVSGLILLVERPVKVGDWIAIGDLQGDVKAINIRATEINMMDRSLLIVPNSELVTKTVRNVTHGGALGRVMLVLHMDNAVSPNAARELVLARLKAHPAVLAEPGPAVYFTDAKNGVLELTALAYVPSPRQAFGAKSELLFEIVEDLQTRGMALSSTSPVVNVGAADVRPRPARRWDGGLRAGMFRGP
jgi:potassium-dependent mechanosensitive channel